MSVGCVSGKSNSLAAYLQELQASSASTRAGSQANTATSNASATPAAGGTTSTVNSSGASLLQHLQSSTSQVFQSFPTGLTLDASA